MEEWLGRAAGQEQQWCAVRSVSGAAHGKGEGAGQPAGQGWIEAWTGSRCCQDRIGWQALGPEAPGESSTVGVDFFVSSTRA